MKITVAIPPRLGRGEARDVGEGRADTNASYDPQPGLSQSAARSVASGTQAIRAAGRVRPQPSFYHVAAGACHLDYSR
jgi:hypothetical protein